MALNKFMHPRNIYRKPPNFKELAIKYPEFRQCVKVELTGKVKLDFKKPEALRALAWALLKKDFCLDVEIPLNRLIPTLPLRLNYVLWIEDLLKVPKTDSEDNIFRGIDIGTGASCIYSLLGAKLSKWHMLATEVDPESVATAQENVDKNELTDLIEVKLVEDGNILKGVLDPDVVYDFCMCNPPFFSSEDDLDPTTKSRSPSRHPPHNAPTGSVSEVVVEGGEVSFIVRLMKESKELGTAVRIYTTKVGQKSSLLLLLVELRNLGVVSSTQTEFCQGNTARWGLAWTFQPGLDLRTVPTIKSGPRKKVQQPMSFCVPKEAVEEYSLDVVTEKVITLLMELQIMHKLLSAKKHLKTFLIKAATNTWAHQRRKRREKLHQKVGVMKNDQDSDSGHESILENDKPSEASKLYSTLRGNDQGEVIPQSTGHQIEDSVESPRNTISSLGSESEVSQDGLSSMSGKRSRDSEDEDDGDETCTKRIRTSSPEPDLPLENCILKATLIVRSLASNIHVELLLLDGSGGREAMHQVLQYLKNRLK